MQLNTEPCMDAGAYARTLSGLTVNLLVSDLARSIAFAQNVLGAAVVYSDPDFALLRTGSAEWMLHADHTYRDHPLSGSLTGTVARGVGAELRLHTCDPDRAEAAARRHGHTILEPALDKPHGLREAYILDPDGYCWVPGVPLAAPTV
jgi:catechol 2,3-dioxygenase-like lactoylglutathione lyase family enzyme